MEDSSAFSDSTEENNQDKNFESKKWIQETSIRSWEPELLISGLAIYLTVNLPGVLQWLYDYYNYNFVLDPESKLFSLTDLIHSILISIAYLLTITFIAHFSLRALWVGMVGLISVYPDGIRFDKIKSYGEYYKEQVKSRLGTVDDFIIKLDQICSVLFSISFMFVILLLGVCWMYFTIIVLFNIIKMLTPVEIFKENESLIYLIIFGVLLLYAFTVGILNLKRFRDKSKAKIWHFYLSWYFGKILFPIVYEPLQYILLTFFSHVSRKKLIAYGVLIFLFFYVILFFTFIQNKVGNIIESRDFYASRSEKNYLKAQHYDNLMDEAAKVRTISIQADVIQDNYLKIFLAYPRSNDLKFNTFCAKTDISDTLNRYQKRELIAQQNLDCMRDYYQIYVDDSLYQQAEFVFYESQKPSKKGFLTYIDIDQLKPGKHLLRIIPADLDSTDRKGYLYALPFWYHP